MTDRQISEKLSQILNELRSQLPAEGFKISSELAEAGESGMGLDDLCHLIRNAKIVIRRPLYNELASLGAMMEMEEKPWLMLESQIQP
jgi:hypothetical protein